MIVGKRLFIYFVSIQRVSGDWSLLVRVVGLIARDMKWILFLRMVGRSHTGRGFVVIVGQHSDQEKKKKKSGVNSLKGHGLLLTCTHKKKYGTRRWRRVFRFSSGIDAFPSLINIAIGEWRDPDQMQGRKTLPALTKGSIIAWVCYWKKKIEVWIAAWFGLDSTEEVMDPILNAYATTCYQVLDLVMSRNLP